MNETEERWCERLAEAHDQHVRTGSDPRWRRLGDVTEMGVLTGIGWANFFAERGARVGVVPAEFWALDAYDTGRVEIDRVSGKDDPVVLPMAVVACPCGYEPGIPKLLPPVECQHGRPSTCPRWFFFDGERVYVFNSPRHAGAVAAT